MIKSISKPVLVAVVMFFAAVNLVAEEPTGPNADSGNSYHLFTKSLHVDAAGVAVVPPRFNWSVETCVAEIDLKGNPTPDSRVMLRLYDPAHNFTALTAQMDLKTAEKLQQDLANIIGKKRQNVNFQYRPQLYNSNMIPTAEVKGVDENGELIIELQPKTPSHDLDKSKGQNND